MNKITVFFQKPLFSNKRFIFAVWMLIALYVAVWHIFHGYSNNFLVFKGAFDHLVNQMNLYAEYPAEYRDNFYYGPIFSVLIAPFALLPSAIGNALWVFSLVFVLFYAIYRLPVAWHYRVIIFYIPLHDLFTSLLSVQTGSLVTTLIIGSYIAVKEGKDFWATCFIALGFFIKLYPVIGLVFFLFSKNKWKFIA
ncbi:MAG: DUF2029 domain-containing protein, partial [Dysgonamonadaceae bacterium]|nr:DUF2029 domain-containing protein [Dysgonamonadaceae bacterium]